VLHYILHRDLLGMYAFGLEEMNMYDQAEKTAKQVGNT